MIMTDQKKLESWIEKLLDTGKKNSLISFKDKKSSTAEILYPNGESVFSKCSVGHVFEVFDPKIPDIDSDESGGTSEPLEEAKSNKKLSREEYKSNYIPQIRNEKRLLVYAQTSNPMVAVKDIAKKAREMQDETGINVAYLAFGFLKWNEREDSEIFYRAPLLLVHVNVITGSILDPVKIEICDDDVIVNPTFDYLLRAEYGLSLPKYEDGDTLAAYYSKVSSSASRRGWEILDECKLGIFSFLKINMYEDLKKNADLILKNKNVRALLGEAGPDIGNVLGDAAESVVQNPLIDLHTVVEADSSQIEAIEMAKTGKSFVLQGPPGTGKSQTITNIIAECLHDGKKVLFVSEKQAALNVVFDKLKKAGLADFCLELHSHKANKKAVIEELNRTLEAPKSAVSSNAQEEIRQKREAQLKLDSYAVELHKKRETIGKSLYQLFELYSAQRNSPNVSHIIRGIQSKGQEYLSHAVKLLEQYSEYVPTVGQNYRQNVWYGFKDLRISYEDSSSFKEDLDSLLRGYRALQGTTAKIKEKYETPDLNFSVAQKWRSRLAFLGTSDVITPFLLSREGYKKALPHLAAMCKQSEVIVPMRDRLLETYAPEVLREVDGKEVFTKLTGQFSSIFSRIFSRDYKNLIAGIRPYLKNGGKLKYQQVVELSEQLMKLQTATKAFDENAALIPRFLGSCYKGPDTDWSRVKSALATLRGYLSDETSSFGSISKMSPESFVENQITFREEADQLNREMSAVEEVKNRVTAKFTTESLNVEKNSYDYCIQKLEGYIGEFDRLRNWISFMDLLKQLDEADLSPFIDVIIEKNIDAKKVADAYLKNFYRQWIQNIIFSTPELASFSRIRQDQAVRNFGEKDKLQYEISKAQIRSELSLQRPNLDVVAGGSAVERLRREGSKKRKQMPIRKLLSETGNLVQIIKPCFLMSPLSVSAFLDPVKISFDTVVFDEASQIFPQDAVGAIYRGKQLIVVGDSKQMPPSNFFNASTENNEDDEDEESGDVGDFESILDVCSSVFTTKSLAWHYRSRYEQLIAFSNLNFYNNKLVTFPSSSKDHKGIGVDYYHVDGVFDRKSKTNREEARFIVDLIYQNIEEHPERSLGVVAFSKAQQNLIDKLLSKRREAYPSCESYFNADNAEPFFIKNLETVQGDERDTIIFSIAYAKDSQGRFIQNFGPLNREGGERRLNVAVTRAKENVQLVASIHYSDIDLSNTKSEGVRLLRAYLDYAQNGEQALERAIMVSNDDKFDSDFELEVCDFLRNNGFTVDTQVGCSGYKIDLALRQPDSSNYLLAIECDGATYHSSKNARDRDSLRQSVLEKMGWQFYRIWSTDWFKNRTVEKEKLLQVAKEAVARGILEESIKSKTYRRKPSVTEEVEESFVAEVKESSFEFPKYRQLDAMLIVQKKRNSLQAAVREILEIEAPLSEDLLLRRIVYLFNREKVTKAVRDEYNSEMRRCEAMGIVRRNGFLYLKGSGKPKFRVPGDRREIEYISIEELAEGLHTLIEQNVTSTRDGLYKTMMNLLGFNRMGAAIEARFEEALTLLKKKNIVKEEEGLLSLQ